MTEDRLAWAAVLVVAIFIGGIVAIVKILANNRGSGSADAGTSQQGTQLLMLSGHDHTHDNDPEYAHRMHAHPELALETHDHPQYSQVGHDHSAQYDKRYAPADHPHPDYVTFDEMQRYLSVRDTLMSFIQSTQAIPVGMIVGAIIGGFIGLVVDVFHPARFFMNHIVVHMPDGTTIRGASHNYLAYFGFPTSGALFGLVLGGLVMWVFRTRRNRQSQEVVTETVSSHTGNTTVVAEALEETR